MGARGGSGNVGGSTRIPADPDAGRSTRVRLVLLDTNAVLLPFRERFPLERELGALAPGAEVAVPVAVLAELHHLSERGEPSAIPALEWARRHRSIESPARGDAALEELGLRLRTAVVTSDRGLIARLRRAGVPVLRPRGARRLVWVAPAGSSGERPSATVKKRPPVERRPRAPP